MLISLPREAVAPAAVGAVAGGLARSLLPENRAGARCVNQGDVTGVEDHFRRSSCSMAAWPESWKTGIKPVVIAALNFVAGAEQIDAAGGDGADFQRAGIAGVNLPQESDLPTDERQNGRRPD